MSENLHRNLKWSHIYQKLVIASGLITDHLGTEVYLTAVEIVLYAAAVLV